MPRKLSVPKRLLKSIQEKVPGVDPERAKLAVCVHCAKVHRDVLVIVSPMPDRRCGIKECKDFSCWSPRGRDVDMAFEVINTIEELKRLV